MASEEEKNLTEVFMVKARRCKRCGGLLTSEQAVADGYGHVCKMKAYIEKYGVPQIDGQISIDDYFRED